VVIDLYGDCDSESGRELAKSTLLSLKRGIRSDAAAMIVDHEWQPGRTFRRRAARAARLGYAAGEIDRTLHEGEIHAINVSSPERQGRPMSDGYKSRPSYSPLDYECDAHRISQYGVFSRAGTLVAYAFVYRVGELRLVSSLLGHDRALRDDVMYLLIMRAIQGEPYGTWVYGEWASGTDGLRFFKERLGFRPTPVVWAF
jgi:hypothetical protein